MTQKVDIDGDGAADGIYLSEEGFRRLMEWEAGNRGLYDEMVIIIEAYK